MNHFQFYGRLATDVDMRQTSGEKPMAIANFNIAVGRKGKGNVTDFFRLTAFSKTAEIIHQYFGKGSRIAVTGHIQNNNYTDRDGNKRSQNEFIIDDFDFVDTKAESQASAPTPTAATSQFNAPSAPEEFVNIPSNIEEELPFK